MSKFKQCTYTIMLMVTCLIASPFIFHQIWKSSAEAKKAPQAPPPAVDTSAPDAPSQNPDGNGNAPAANTPSATDPAAPDQPADPDNTSGEPEQGSDDKYHLYYAYESADPSYFSDALFIGDSRTVGIKEYGTLKNADYFCSIGLAASKINSEKINGKTFDQFISDKQYRKVYIMLGINEVGNDFESTATAYRAVVEKIKVHQPNAIIYIQSNLHVSLAASTSVINNDNINYLNSLLEGLADYSRVYFIDVNQIFDDDHGDLTASYTSDGIHPLAEYYKQWCEWLCNNTVPVKPIETTAPASTEAEEKKE